MPDIIISGSASVISPHWSYIGSSGLLLGGESSVISPHWSYSGNDGLTLGGTALVAVTLSHAASDGLSIGGSASAAITQFNYATSGVVSIGGSSSLSFDYDHISSGGIVIGGEALTEVTLFATSDGGVTVGGESSYQISGYRHVSSGGISLGGGSELSTSYDHVGSGGISLGGSSVASTVVRWTAEGGITLTTSPFLPTDQSFTVFFDQQIEWNVVGTATKDLKLIWDTGQTGLFWFRVQCKCLDAATDDPCDTTTFNSNDTACGNNPPAGQAMFKMIAAQNVSDLCEKLSETTLFGPFRCQIDKIERFTRPVETSQIQSLEDQGVDLTCNELVEVPFEEIAGCIEFSINEELTDDFGFNTSVVNTFFVYEGSGGFSIGGEVPFTSGRFDTVADGGLSLAGSANVISSHWSYVPDTIGGDLLIGGRSSIVSSLWHYEADGGLEISGESSVVSPHWSWEGTGDLLVSGGSNTRYRLSWTPLYPQLNISGSAGSYVATYVGSGGLSIGGTGNGMSSYYSHVGSEGIVLGGESDIVSSAFSWVGQEGLSLGGFAQIGREHEASGGVTIGGTAPHGWLKRVTGDGGISTVILISGNANVVSKGFTWVGSGGLTLGGETATNFLSSDNSDTGATMELVELSVDFEETEAPSLTIDTGTVTTACGCGPLPLVLNIRHNFNFGNYLISFLKRTGNFFPTRTTATFRNARDSWQSNFHFVGVGDDPSTLESWDVVFEFSCTDNVGGVDLQTVIWKFCALFKRKNLTTGEDSDSKLVFTFPTDTVCVTGILRTIDFGFVYDTQSGTVLTNNGATAETVVVHDNIGLFTSVYWVGNPELEIDITTAELPADVTRVDITPLFPFDPTSPLAAQDAVLSSN